MRITLDPAPLLEFLERIPQLPRGVIERAIELLDELGTVEPLVARRVGADELRVALDLPDALLERSAALRAREVDLA